MFPRAVLLLLAASVSLSSLSLANEIEGTSCSVAQGNGTCLATSDCFDLSLVPVDSPTCGSSGDVSCCLPAADADEGEDEDDEDEFESEEEESLSARDLEARKPNGQLIANAALRWLGRPYVVNGGSCVGPTGATAKKGFSDTGLVEHAVCKVTHKNLFSKKTAKALYCAGIQGKLLGVRKVPIAQRQVGDAIFFGGICNCVLKSGSIRHVGLLTNAVTMVHAPGVGKTVRRQSVASVSLMRCPFVLRF